MIENFFLVDFLALHILGDTIIQYLRTEKILKNGLLNL
ncbi:hypothetical protein KAOT1_08273 [Kordia algicida OT-1]|uniref:Uncharacterized protein n=1 Tax=Kordia algicida OT-1 TaxID=391587 RepID=A9DYL9_9FLAO|nr:hypothetical protein KAOT1_08273 [Kordia algicida OT-1]